MNSILLVIAILFYIAGIVGGTMEKDIGMMLTGIALGTLLLFWRYKRIKDAPDREKIKRIKRRYKYLLTDEGKKALMPYLSEDELDYSWNTIAMTYSTDEGYELLWQMMKDEQALEDIEE